MHIKERLAYVDLDPEKEMAKPEKALEKIYEHLDENVLSVGKKSFRYPEALFHWKAIRVERLWASHEKGIYHPTHPVCRHVPCMSSDCD